MRIKRWIIQAPIGLIFIGAGLSMAVDAGFNKSTGNPWFIYGTFSLLIFNAGICVFGDSLVRRMKEEYDRNQNGFPKN